jgi:hypothetical protein
MTCQIHHTRLAEDADVHLAELERILDAIDVVLLAADHECDHAEHVLVMHGKARRLLAAAIAR